MTLSGSKVEGFEVEAEEVSNVVVGKILAIEKHPDADKLVVCQLDVGQGEPLQIVTGATNVFVGAIVPVALDGAHLPGGVKIRKGKLRGVESCGMLCSIAELGVTEHDFPGTIADGIMIITEPCEIGQDIHEALGLNDVCVEFEITPNRPDCLSVIGLAREASATFSRPMKEIAPCVKNETGDIHELLSVTVENSELCPRYTAKVIKNVKIAPSPRWMRERLRASGVRPINNLVDITNYVMLEYGQPMHAFDLRHVEGSKIVVRNAREGETIMTLDGTERALSPEMLVICDEKKPSAVAGVMGGEYSGIMDDTVTVVFESANFKGSSIRTTAKKLGMRTESSARFEKGLDAQNTVPAVLRACQLVEELGAGEVVGGIIDIDNTNYQPAKIKFQPNWISNFLGIEIPAEEQKSYLEKLQFTVEDDIITVPSWRGDVEHKADIAEEVVRLYGYDKIPSTQLLGEASGGYTPRQQFDRDLSRLMRAAGCYEVATYSFISPKYYDKIHLPADSELRKSIVITNPLGEDSSIMRTTALPSMMEVLARNYNARSASARLYEQATEYYPTEPDQLPIEQPKLIGGFYGASEDFFSVKGVVELIAREYGITGMTFTAKRDDPTFHPGRCAEITVGEQKLGTVGQVHPLVADEYGIDTEVYLFTLDMDVLFENRDANKQYKQLPKFPAVTRDLALLCADELPVGEIEACIRRVCGKLLEEVTLFDIYKGQQIESGKKSVAYSMVLRSAEKTLTDSDCEAVMQKLMKELEKMEVSLRM